MTYSFGARGATKAMLLTAIAMQFDAVVAQDPAHDIDRDLAMANATNMLRYLPEDDTKAYVANISGYYSGAWCDDGHAVQGRDGCLRLSQLTAGCSVYVVEQTDADREQLANQVTADPIAPIETKVTLTDYAPEFKTVGNGPNPFFEGNFDGETDEQADARRKAALVNETPWPIQSALGGVISGAGTKTLDDGAEAAGESANQASRQQVTSWANPQS